MAGLVAGCGSDNKSSSSGGGSAGTPSGGGGAAVEGAKVIDIKAMDTAKGDVTYCQGKDSSGNAKAMVDAFNKTNSGVTLKMVEFPASADEQRNQFIQRQQAKSGECDIFSSDVIWTAEFASQKWLYDMTPYIQKRESEFIPATFETVKYGGKFWGVPDTTDAAFLYYRTDQVKTVPATWQEVYKIAAANDGIVYQGAAYEGLTCDFLELAFAAGGKVLSDDGKTAEFDSPENVKALQFMVDGIKNGAAPKAVTTYMEEEARRAFEAGRATFERNWPYAYAAGKKNKKAPDFKVAPFPTFEGGGKAGILGGHNNVISVYSKNPGGALKVIEYMAGKENQVRNAAEFSLAPTLSAVYDDPAVKKALPFAAELKQAVAQAHARPVSPVYTQISQAIYQNVNKALSGEMEPAAAIKAAQDEMSKALKTF
jgi:multiple sugar transport system substrate-binding protein